MEWLYGASENSNMEVDIGYIPQVSAPWSLPARKAGLLCEAVAGPPSLAEGVPSWRGASGRCRVQDGAPGTCFCTRNPTSATALRQLPAGKEPWLDPGLASLGLRFPTSAMNGVSLRVSRGPLRILAHL